MNPNPSDRGGVWKAATLVLACALVGIVGGGVLKRLRAPAGAPPERRLPSGVEAPARPLPPALVGVLPDLGAAQAPAPTTAPVGDGGPAAPRRGIELWVEVLDPLGQPAVGAAVLARRALAPGQSLSQSLGPTPVPAQAREPQKATAPLAIGELGVLPGPLPFPEDVIGGRYTPGGSIMRGAGDLVGSASATTGPDGRARLTGVPSGYVQLLASRDALGAAAEIVVPEAAAGSSVSDGGLRLVLRLGTVGEASCPSAAEAPADPEGEALVSSTEGPEINGQVVDARGQPVVSARIEAAVGKRRQLGLTDARGGFSVRGLPLGALVLQVQKAGYAPLLRTQRADEPRQDLRLTLGAGGGIAGSVRDARLGGLPPGAQLTLESVADPQARQAVALSPDGSFRATGLLPGDLVLRARAPGFAPLVQTVRVSEGRGPDAVTTRDVVLSLERGAAVIGQVNTHGADTNRAGISVLAEEPGGRTVGRALTDEHGEFEIADLPAGRLRITASGSAGRDSTQVELRPNDRSRVVLELR